MKITCMIQCRVHKLVGYRVARLDLERLFIYSRFLADMIMLFVCHNGKKWLERADLI